MEGEKPVAQIPTAKFVFSDIVNKAKQWSNMYPYFKEGMEDGYKNPSSCFRKTGDGNDSDTKYYDEMVKDMRDKIEAIAGTDWGETYHTKMRAANTKEMEKFNKTYMKKFGHLGLESLLLGSYEPLDDGIECGAETKVDAKADAEAEVEPDAKADAEADAEAEAGAKADAGTGSELNGGNFTNGHRRSRRRRKHNRPCRKSRKNSRNIRCDS